MPPYQVTLAFDRTGWCFHRIAMQCVDKLCDEFQFRVAPHLGLTHGETDVLVNLWWNSTLRLKAAMKARSIVTCVYDGLSWSIDEAARHQFKLTLMHTDILAVCNREFASQIQDEFDDVPPVMLIEDGVDTERFHPLDLPPKPVLGWCGSSSRMTPGGPADQKGVNFLKRIAKEVGINCSILDVAGGGAWSHRDMPQFYSDISIYACASHKEGTPNPVLEAMACGRPVISTPVGLVPQLVEAGVSGFIVPKTDDAWRAALAQLKTMPFAKLQAMGAEARKAVEPYDWKIKIEQFRDVFREAIKISNRPKAAELKRSTNAPDTVKASPHFIRAETINRIPRPKRTRKKILLISDVENWAFHQNMKDLEIFLSHRYDFDHWFVVDFQKHTYVPELYDYDCIFCVYHRWPIMGLLPWDRSVGSLRSLWFKPEKKGPPDWEDTELVNRFRAFHVVTQHNYNELRDSCPNVVYLTNPINMGRFPELTPQREFVCSWNGNASHWPVMGDVKGFNTIIKDACSKSGVELSYAEYNSKRISPEDMPAFYREASVALCASMYEGASNSVMEAMASGLALITTDVGNHKEMHRNQMRRWNDSGIVFVKDRSVVGFVDAITKLYKDGMDRVREMGELNRREIIERWSWEKWVDGYDDFLQKGWA
jgi:glycosyltransferase involved in cell wall biosynthesis